MCKVPKSSSTSRWGSSSPSPRQPLACVAIHAAAPGPLQIPLHRREKP
jgi:hypothetical protein